MKKTSLTLSILLLFAGGVEATSVNLLCEQEPDLTDKFVYFLQIDIEKNSINFWNETIKKWTKRELWLVSESEVTGKSFKGDVSNWVDWKEEPIVRSSLQFFIDRNTLEFKVCSPESRTCDEGLCKLIEPNNLEKRLHERQQEIELRKRLLKENRKF